ncbi:MAG: HAD family hydrolase [Clostridiales bacterium]|nr:HAD family hydrolase [Clostridiales bacterium]
MLHPEIRLAALDMDGTLLHDDSSISDHTLAVIARLIAKGILVVPASGRNFESLPERLRTLPGIRYGVCANGANIVELPGGKHLHDFPINPEDARAIAAYLTQYPLFLYVFSNRGTWHSGNWTELGLNRIYPGFSFPPTLPGSLETFLSCDPPVIDKMGIFTPYETVFREIEQNGSPVPSVTMLRAGQMTLEMNSIHATKEHGLRVLCRQLGIPLSQVLAIGDNQNDVTMLQAAGVSVAMGNSGEDVRAEADYIAGTNEEDGAAAFLEEFFDLS